MKTLRTLTLAMTLALVAVVLGAAVAGVLSPDARTATQARLFSFGSTLIAMTIMGKRFPF